MDNEVLRPLNDLSYVLECAAVEYTGELKTELEALCGRIKAAEVGYRAPVVVASLTQLEQALDLFRKGDRLGGGGKLAAISRKWWAVAP